MINDQLAISLQNWLEDTLIPDEHFYSTLATVNSYKYKVLDNIHPLSFVRHFIFSERYCKAGPLLSMQRIGMLHPICLPEENNVVKK